MADPPVPPPQQQQNQNQSRNLPVLVKQVRVQKYADLATVEKEIDRLLKCEHDRRHPCLQSAAYIQFRQEMIHTMVMNEALRPGSQRTVAQVYLPQGLIARLVLFEEKCGGDEENGPRREGMGVQLLWRAEFYEPSAGLDPASRKHVDRPPGNDDGADLSGEEEEQEDRPPRAPSSSSKPAAAYPKRKRSKNVM